MPVDNNARQSLQNDLVAEALSDLNSGKNVFINAPTGFGKTNMGISISQNMDMSPNNQKEKGIHLFLQDRISLSEQNANRAKKLGHKDVGLWNDGNYSQKGKLIFSTIDTALLAGDNIPKISLLLIDEAHHAAETKPGKENTEHTEIIERLLKKNQNLKIVALSGTKKRADEQKLHPLIENAVDHTISMYQAMGTKAVTPVETEQHDWKTRDGKSALETLQNIAQNRNSKHEDFTSAVKNMKPHDFEDQAVKIWKASANNTPTFAYADSIVEAEKLTEAFQKAGVKAASIHSGLSKKQINSTLEDYRSGKITVLSSVDMLTEGIDETKTQTILNTKTSVNALDLAQMKGRATRAHTEQTPSGPKEKTMAKVIDLGATPYTTGTAESLIDTETMIKHGPNTSKMRLWKLLEKDPKTLSIPTEKKTYYAINTGEKGGPTGKTALYHIYQSEPRKETDISKGSRITRLTKSPATAHDVSIFARKVAEENERWIAQKESLDSKGLVIPGIRFVTEKERPATLLGAIAKKRWIENKNTIEAAHAAFSKEDKIEEQRMAAGKQKARSKTLPSRRDKKNDFGI